VGLYIFLSILINACTMLSFSAHTSQVYVTTGLIVDQYNLSFDLLGSNLHWNIFLLA
jgi:uncharacterized membrane protein